MIRCATFFTALMNLHDFPSVHVITAAPVLTMPDTRSISVLVVNLLLPTCHALGESHDGKGKCGCLFLSVDD